SAGRTLSDPMPTSGRTRRKSTRLPLAASASTQACACASLLSTSVPSTSRSTARYGIVPIASTLWISASFAGLVVDHDVAALFGRTPRLVRFASLAGSAVGFDLDVAEPAALVANFAGRRPHIVEIGPPVIRRVSHYSST